MVIGCLFFRMPAALGFSPVVWRSPLGTHPIRLDSGHLGSLLCFNYVLSRDYNANDRQQNSDSGGEGSRTRLTNMGLPSGGGLSSEIITTGTRQAVINWRNYCRPRVKDESWSFRFHSGLILYFIVLLTYQLVACVLDELKLFPASSMSPINPPALFVGFR